MEPSFSTLAILSMVFNTVVGIGLPVLLVILIKKKYDMRIGTLFIGACAYIGANMFLQGIFDTVISMITPVAQYLVDNPMPRVIIMAVCHGAIQLGGYFLMINMFMKDFRRKENSLMYGVGIRIIDSIMGYGINSGAVLLTLAVSVNKQGLSVYDDGTAEGAAAKASVIEFIEMPVIEIFGAGIMCICVMFIAIAISVLVFQIAKRENKKYLLSTAAALAVLNCLLPEMYSAGIITGIGKFIILLVLLAVVSCVIAYFVYIKDTDEVRGKGDILVKATARAAAAKEMSMRDKLSKISKSSLPGDEE